MATDVPECRETVVPEESDLLFNSKDKDAAYIAMVDILKMAPYERETIGLQGSKYVEENFNR